VRPAVDGDRPVQHVYVTGKLSTPVAVRQDHGLGPAIPPDEIVLGKRGITADTALRLARLLKTSPQLWMRLQADWDLQRAIRRERKAS
jgi:hypothetical protein